MEAWGGVPQGVRDPPGCNVPEFRPCESVLHPCSHRRQLRELYGQARKALKANAKREHNALEWASVRLRSRPNEISGARASTASLILSIFFLKVLWISDPTSKSATWVGAAIRKMEIGVSAGRPPAGRSAAECTGSGAPRARVSLIKLMNASASLTLH